jgi:hypothetical protein
MDESDPLPSMIDDNDNLDGVLSVENGYKQFINKFLVTIESSSLKELPEHSSGPKPYARTGGSRGFRGPVFSRLTDRLLYPRTGK